SCIFRVREASGFGFGAQHIIAVLRGQDNARVRQYGHEQLSTFGIGADLDEREWRAVLRQLIAQGLVAVDHERHQVLVLTSDSRALLRGERRLSMRRPVAPPRPRGRKRGAGGLRGTGASAAPASGLDATAAGALGAGAGPLADDPAAERLFERLREWRREAAIERKLPPYVIFHDSTLRAIAQHRPQTL